MHPDVSDEHLVIQAQKGDRDAFLTLYNRYLKKVYNRVKSRVPLTDVEDVTQDIFIAVVRSLESFEQRSRFSTWLYTIVNRQIADYYRRRSRKNSEEMVSLDDGESEGLQVAAEMKNWDEQVMVQQALLNLSENHQEIIMLRFADGLTFAEIAEKRGQSLEAVKSLYRRAIQALADSIGGTGRG